MIVSRGSRNNPGTSRPYSKPCQFCGGNWHPRRTCPARSGTCHNCNKYGHWSKVCRSTQDEANTLSSVLCAIETNSSILDVHVDGSGSVPALIDTGATQSFISSNLLAKNDICYTESESQTKLANLSTLSTLGFVQLKFELAGCHHENQFIVADTLVKDSIIGIGMYVLSKHRGLELQGSLPRLNVKHESTGYLSVVFPALDIEPHPLSSGNTIQAAKPISTKARFCKKEDGKFMQTEVTRLLEGDIIEVSRSPWRDQASVVNGKKSRMVIDYSATINRFVEVDAHPFPKTNQMLSTAAEDTVFSTYLIEIGLPSSTIISSWSPLYSL